MAKLRIIGGRARGRILREAVAPGVRPTTERVREALFSMLGQDMQGQTVLDAFAGSGMLALEAWSRGARVTAVEKNRRALTSLRRRVEEVGADCTVRNGDVLKLVPSLTPFDGIFVDPPYKLAIEPILLALAPLATDWLVAETAAGVKLPSAVGPLRLETQRSYGNSQLWVYRVPDDGSGRSPVDL